MSHTDLLPALWGHPSHPHLLCDIPVMTHCVDSQETAHGTEIPLTVIVWNGGGRKFPLRTSASLHAVDKDTERSTHGWD